MNRLSPWLLEFFLLLAIGAVFGRLGPYGTDAALGPLNCYVYWMLIMPMVGLPASWGVRTVARSRSLRNWPAGGQAVAGSVIAGLPGTFIVIAIGALFGGTPRSSIAEFAMAYVNVTLVIVVIAVPVVIIENLIAKASQKAGSTPPAPSAGIVTPSPFLARIPAKLGTKLLYLETEDHYLRVHTELGSDLILLRLSDACGELEPSFGQQVHRSYWVAKQAVAGIERDGRKLSLRLSNGAVIPVSRTYLSTLREAGWLSPPGGSPPA